MLPEYITDGPLFLLATAIVLGRYTARCIRRYARIAWNAAIRTFILWPLDCAIAFEIWRTARRNGLNAEEKKAFAEEIWTEARCNDPA
jgi:hypothetical protein